jgi:O-antigen/teichoic acid export membrane protein
VLVVTHGLSTRQAGAFLEATALFLILSNIGDLGADDGLLRGLARARALGLWGAVRPLIVAALVPVAAVGVSLGLLSLGLADWLAGLFFSPPEHEEGRQYITAIALFLPFASVTNVAVSGSRGLGAMRPYVLIQNLILPAARLAAVAIAVAAGAAATAIGIVWGLPALPAAAVAVSRLARRAQRLPEGSEQPIGAVARDLWSFSLPRALAGTFGVTVTYADVLLVGALASTHAAAIYAAISRLYLVATYALQALRTAVAPQFSELIATDQRSRLQAVYQLSTWWAMLFCFPVYVTFAVFSPVVASVFGHDYRSGGDALVILSLAGLVTVGTGGVTLLLLMSGHSGLNMVNAGAGLAVNLVLNLLLIPGHGIEGAAIAWATSIVLTNVAAAVQVGRLLRIRPFGRGYAIVAGASALAYGVAGLFLRVGLGTTLPSLIVAVVLGTLVYAICLWPARHVLQLAALRGLLGRARNRTARALG